MVDMDKLSCLAQLRRSMMSNPLYKARLEQSRYESYKKALDAYHAKEFRLTHEQIDKIIRAIKSGKNTYSVDFTRKIVYYNHNDISFVV